VTIGPATTFENNPADAFLRKPFVPPTLLQCIQRVLSSDFKGICHDVVVSRFGTNVCYVNNVPSPCRPARGKRSSLV
jgi:hypothetical protein